MDRKTKKLIMVAFAFAALIGVYFVTSDIRPDVIWHAEEQEPLPNLIDKGDAVRVVDLHIDNGYDLRFIRDMDDGTEVGTWRLLDHWDLRLDQIAVSTVGFSVRTLPYHGEIAFADLAGDLEMYGLGSEAVRLTIYYSDDSREVLYVGSTTPDGRFNYAMLEGADSIHLIDNRTGVRMFFGHNNFIDRNLPRPDVVSLVSMEFLIEGDKFIFETAPPDGVEHFGWMRDEFISRGVGLGKRLDMAFSFGALFEPLTGLRFAGVILEPDDLAVYGLAEPSLMMRITDVNDVTLHFYVGGETEDGLRYIKLHEESFVYTIAPGIIERLEGVDRSRVFQRRLTDVVVTQAEVVRVRGMGRDVTIRPNSSDEDGRIYRSIFETRWDSYIDPIDVSGLPLVWRLDIDGHIPEDSIIERQLDIITEGNFTRQPDGSIRYSLTYTFHVLDDLFYAISRDGGEAVTAISRNVLDRVMSGIE
ncbi:MAG: DUF4340 domain-containing protein [Defluviitaleaceae bacterium]|nr:DUF4340 domain-containing protein [Defluviitaleaceae bacterium]